MHTLPDVMKTGKVVQDSCPAGAKFVSSDPSVLTVSTGKSSLNGQPEVTLKAIKPGKAKVTISLEHEIEVIPPDPPFQRVEGEKTPAK